MSKTTAQTKTAPAAKSVELGPTMSGSEILVACLEREGVDTIFAYPGGASMEIHQALTRSKKIRTVLPRHEQGGAFAADGYGRATGRAGVCMATSGPGLWFGWFGFNAGSTFQALGTHFAEVAVVTNLSVACGVIGAAAINYFKEKNFDIAMIGNGAIAGAVAITAPSGYVEPWAAVPIGLLGGVIVVLGLNWIDGKLDDPIGAITAHGMVGLWGTIAVGLFAFPKFAEQAGVGVKSGDEFIGGLVYSGSFHQVGIQLAGVAIVAAFVFTTSLAVFGAIKYTIGMRVSPLEEDDGLDISDHGMYGYPEIFIPTTELADPGMPGATSYQTHQSVGTMQ